MGFCLVMKMGGEFYWIKDKMPSSIREAYHYVHRRYFIWIFKLDTERDIWAIVASNIDECFQFGDVDGNKMYHFSTTQL